MVGRGKKRERLLFIGLDWIGGRKENVCRLLDWIGFEKNFYDVF